ncbi:MAG: DUF3285 domain-containing protein [Pegethrix bostrychoides GSE-TBD4-15B]|jgi:hypothetical protein|uniref:DUF3285 domain-containing protein n=1 Tax=Pegethrix bostrychoides GSE-TBD4-15B TaxID=2839662 RepID=A0A951U3A7_9CYAN|nr:DUF3285 domain-containing protein [Pegethrix bostrychoides GSE-TBD4-15B]
MSPSSELSSQQDAKRPDAKEPQANPAGSSPPPSYVKLAMRNMVRKGGKSLFHFGLTTAGLLGLLLGLAYLTR